MDDEDDDDEQASGLTTPTPFDVHGYTTDEFGTPTPYDVHGYPLHYLSGN